MILVSSCLGEFLSQRLSWGRHIKSYFSGKTRPSGRRSITNHRGYEILFFTILRDVLKVSDLGSGSPLCPKRILLFVDEIPENLLFPSTYILHSPRFTEKVRGYRLESLEIS